MKWTRDVAERSGHATASEEEREALYLHIIGTKGKLDRKTKSLLRKSPVLKDHQGHWVAPSAITGSRVSGARHLEPVLHFPHQDYSSDSDLSRALGFRRKVDGDDLVSFAKLVAENNEYAERFEEALWNLRRLLSPQVLRKLSHYAFVRNSLGGVSQPGNTYLRTPLNGVSLGQETPFVVGDRPSLYRPGLGAKKSHGLLIFSSTFPLFGTVRNHQQTAMSCTPLWWMCFRRKNRSWILSLTKRSYGLRMLSTPLQGSSSGHDITGFSSTRCRRLLVQRHPFKNRHRLWAHTLNLSHGTGYSC